MLSSDVIRTIAFTLAHFQIIPENSQPSEIATYFQSFAIDEIHNLTKLDKWLITEFIDQTLPCLTNISVKYASQPNVSLHDMMWIDCFFYIVPVPEQKAKCDDTSLRFLINLCMLTLSVILLFIFSCFIQRRQRACVTCCFGFPGPVVPLNMLDSYENRKGNMLAFGVIVTSIISVLMGDNAELLGRGLNKTILVAVSKHSFIGIFVKIFLSLYVAIINYPLFVAQNIHNKLIGSLLGIFITALWLGMEMFKFVAYSATCFIRYRQDSLQDLAIIVVFFDVPKIICLFLLLVKFVYILYKTCSHRRAKQRQGLKVDWLYGDDTDWREEYMYVHVKEVFKKHLKEDSDDEHLTMKQKILKGIRSKLYEKRIGFQYSTRIIVSTFVAAIAVYVIALLIVMGGYIFFTVIFDLIFSSVIVQAVSDATGLPLEIIKDYVLALKVSYWLALALSILFYILVTMNSLTWYRRHILKLRTGDRSFLPNSINKNTLPPGALMTASFKFAGFQVAYSVWGFVLSYMVFVIACYVVLTQVFMPMFRGELSILLTLIIKLWPNILIAIAMIIIQKLIAMKIFLQDDETLAVDNRRAYHIASYFFFYFNVLLGLVSCLLRIIIGLVLGVIFMQRLSKSTLPRSYERRDPGYLSYLGFILLEHQHSNPVLQCFVRLLLETQNIDLKDEFFSDPNATKDSVMKMMKLGVEVSSTEKEREKRRRKNVIRNRWYLYSVLHRNPSIIKYRIRYLKLNNKKKSSAFSKSFFFGLKEKIYNGNKKLPEAEKERGRDGYDGDKMNDGDNGSTCNSYKGDVVIAIGKENGNDNTGNIMELKHRKPNKNEENKGDSYANGPREEPEIPNLVNHAVLC